MDNLKRLHAECVGDEVAVSQPPPPRHFHSCANRREILKDLWFGLSNGEAGVLTAAEDIGKTFLCRELLQRLPVGVRSIFLVAPEQRGHRLPETIFRSMALIRRRDDCSTPWAVIIDEAQRCDAATLERVAELREHIARQDSPVGMLFVGRPALETVLARAHLLDVQIAMRWRLSAFATVETASYINRWVRRQSAPRVAFTEAANRIVHHATGGAPGRINEVCQRILERARERGAHSITGMMAAQAAWASWADVAQLRDPAGLLGSEAPQ